jgi:hypothetical protein
MKRPHTSPRSPVKPQRPARPMLGLLLMVSVIMASFGVVACDEEIAGDASAKTGELVFTMNGEGFARDGFVSEDGWRVAFAHVYANVHAPAVFQVADPGTETETETQALSAALSPRAPTRMETFTPLLAHAGHPHAEIPDGSASASLDGSFLQDLHLGEGPIEIGRVEDAAIGNYNYLNFSLLRAEAPDASAIGDTSQGLASEALGYSLVFIGTATKDTESLAFTIRFTEELLFEACGPHPDNIGVVTEGGEGRVELTFHFDHIFGDAEEGPADTEDPETVNALAVGFGPFASLAVDGVIDVDQQALSALAEYGQLIEALGTVGHTGEAHCHIGE